MMEQHLSEHTVAAYVDGGLGAAERRQAEAHLAECSECRAEVVDVTRIVRPRRKRFLVAVPLAVAATLVLFLARPQSDVVLRGASQRQIQVAGEFVWHPIPDVSEYRATVTTAAGDVIAEKITSDTTVQFPLLPPHGSFRWFVSAVLPNGSAVSSPVSVVVR